MKTQKVSIEHSEQEPITLPTDSELIAAIQRAAEAAGPKLLQEFFNDYKHAHLITQPTIPGLMGC